MKEQGFVTIVVLLAGLLVYGCTATEEDDTVVAVGSPCTGDGLVCSTEGEKLLQCEASGYLGLVENCTLSGKECVDGACVGSSGSDDPLANPDQDQEEKNDDLTAPDSDTPTSECGWEDPNGDDDEDGIPNQVEGCGDRDGDGTPDYLDHDTDGDGILDSVECPEQPCRDTDDDGIPDHLDKDSDSDGIADKEEAAGCTDPYKKDTDGDGSDDLAEVVYDKNNPGIADPCDPNKTIPEGLFYVVLPYNGLEAERELEFSTVIEAIDVLFVIDASGSMSGEIENVQKGVKTHIIDKLKQQYADPNFAAFGLSRITFGGTANFLRQEMTLSADEIKASLDDILPLADDTFAVRISEMASLPLYYSANPEGFNGHASLCPPMMGCIAEAPISFPPADCNGALGPIGHACFRKKSMPIYIYITDDIYEDCDPDNNPDFDKATNCVWRNDQPGYMNGPTFEDAISMMASIGAKFIGIDTWQSPDVGGDSDTVDPIDNMKLMAQVTGSLDKNGDPFIYRTSDPEGNGMPEQIGQAIIDLTTFIDMDVTTGKMSDEECDGTSAAEFVKSATTVKAEPENGVSGKNETTFLSVQQGTTVWFNVKFHNDFCKNTTTEPAVYNALVTVLGNGSYLSSRLVKVIVPGSLAE